MPETAELELDKLDLNDPGAIQKLRDAYEHQKDRASKVTDLETQIAESVARERTRDVQTILREMHVPETLAELYPTDGKIEADSIRNFVRDKVGMEPDKDTDAWRRYDKLRSNSEPMAPAEDETDKWVKTEMQKTEDFYRRQNLPTPEEEKDIQQLKARVTRDLATWDQEVQSGQRDPIFSPQGFGGFLDPPSYARRARNFVSLT
jgi:hypothetical protein